MPSADCLSSSHVGNKHKTTSYPPHNISHPITQNRGYFFLHKSLISCNFAPNYAKLPTALCKSKRKEITNINKHNFPTFMKRQHFLKSTLCLLLALVCNVAWAEVTPPTFSTEDAPVWYYIQFKTGGNLLNAPEAKANLKTISVGDRSATTQWMLVGNAESFYLKNANGDYVGWSGSRFTATTEGSKATLKISESTHDAGYYDIQRTGQSNGMNQWGGTNAGVELGEYSSGSNNSLLFVSCTSVSSPALPLFSTEDAPEWYMIQFTAGGAVLSDQGADKQVITAAKAITEANLWQFVGTKESFYL